MYSKYIILCYMPPALKDQKIKLLAIPGSLRPDSINRSLMKGDGEIAPAGINVQIYDDYADLPVFTEPLDNGPEPNRVRELRDQIRDADALLSATREHTGSIFGGLQNAIDWASRPYGNSALAGKTTLVAGASPSPYGAKWAQAGIRRVLGVGGADVDRVRPTGRSGGRAIQR